jgi:single-strand DNA-binding protein
MARGLNRVTIIGQLGRNPEMRYTPSGRPVTTFSVVVSRTWQGIDGVVREDYEWFNIVAWDSLAERCNAQLGKGHSIYVEGRQQTRIWQDETGKPNQRTEVIASDMIVLTNGANDHQASVDAQLDSDYIDDGPFPF